MFTESRRPQLGPKRGMRRIAYSRIPKLAHSQQAHSAADRTKPQLPEFGTQHVQLGWLGPCHRDCVCVDCSRRFAPVLLRLTVAGHIPERDL